MITCSKCRALLEPGTAECPYCKTDQRRHRAPSEAQDAERTSRFGHWILGVIVSVFFLMILLDPARDDPGTGRFKPSDVAQVMFGAAHPHFVERCGQVWRLLASMFLHVDLLHLILNAIALLYLVSIAAGTFGVHRTVCLYFASGVCGSLLSHLSGAGGVGASGALCGLIGACAIYGKRRGGATGDALMRRMLGWAAFIAVLGLAWNRMGAASRIDNAGHLGGFVGGAAVGWIAAGARARGGRADRAWTLLARATVVGALVAAAVFWVPSVLRIFERREMELYGRQADRTLRAVAASLDGGRTEDLPERFSDGPSGTERVRDAVREALARARDRDRGAAAALARATDALDAWSESLLCSHYIHLTRY